MPLAAAEPFVAAEAIQQNAEALLVSQNQQRAAITLVRIRRQVVAGTGTILNRSACSGWRDGVARQIPHSDYFLNVLGFVAQRTRKDQGKCLESPRESLPFAQERMCHSNNR